MAALRALFGRITRRRGVHVRTVLQMEAAECGAACLTMILDFHGILAHLQDVREVCAVSRNGISALRIATAARSYGLAAKGFRTPVEALGAFTTPFIVFWNQNHFVVVEKVGPRSVRINDPASGRRAVDIDNFAASFSAVALTFENEQRAPALRRRRERPGFLRLAGLLGRSRRGVLVAVIAGVCATIPSTAAAVLTALFAEQVLGQHATEWAVPVLVLAVIVLFLQAALALLQQRTLVAVRTLLSGRLNSVFLWRLLRLPVRFFDARSPGGLVSRLSLNSALAGLVSDQLANAAIGAVAVIVFGTVLLLVNPILGGAAIGLALVNVVVLASVSRIQVATSQELQRASVQLSGYTFTGIDMMDDIRANGSQDEYFSRWAGIQARAVNAQQRLGVVNQRLMSFPAFLSAINVVVVLGVGGVLEIAGHISVPELIAVQALSVSFFAPIGQIVGVAGQFQSATAWLTQLDDVADQPLAPNPVVGPKFLDPKGQHAVSATDLAEDRDGPFAGAVDIQDITFGYVRTDPPLIRDFSLHIEPGRRVALVGPSGSGKSTLADLVAGVHEPWSGEVKFDGRSRQDISPEALAASLAKVDQTITLFSGTIADNIAFFDSSVSAAAIAKAADDAALSDEIYAKTGGFTHRLSEGGRNLSGGQRQRLEIARGLAIEPSVIILDEATSSLDTITEAHVTDRIRDRGCTCLIVAHRLSTIRDCDEIVVLDGGVVVGRGSHDELIESNALYQKLVNDE